MGTQRPGPRNEAACLPGSYMQLDVAIETKEGKTMTKQLISSIALILALGLVSVAPVRAGEAISLTACPGFISTPGTYRLDADVSTSLNACMRITASNVTIDLNGYTITGPGYGVGIGTGVELYLKRVKIIGPGKVENFGNGVELQDVSNSKVSKVVSTDNVASGIHVLRSDKNVVERCITFNNGLNGISVVGHPSDPAESNAIRRNEVIGNNNVGIRVDDAENNHIEANNVSANGPYNMYFYAGGDNNLVENNIVVGGQTYDISDNGTANTFTNNLCETANNSACPNLPDFDIDHF